VEHFTGAERTCSSSEDPAHAGGLGAAGARKAALLVGVIHGVWHWPLFFMDPGAPFLFPLVYLLFTCSLSILLSWGTLRSGSVWPAAVGHGTIRPYSGLAMYPLKGPAVPLLGPDATGLVGGIGYTLLALALLTSRRAFAGEKDASSEKVPAVVAA